MAKLTGPLFSLDARGKLGSSLVFIGWKGIKTVRQWLKPANPQSADQGNVRCIIGGLGRAIGKVAKDSTFHDKIKDLELIPDQQSKQSYLVQYIKDHYLGGAGATLTGYYASQLASLAGHTKVTSFSVGANALGILAFDVDYDTIAPFKKALGLYLLARFATTIPLAGSPYSIALASWTGKQIDAMVAEMTVA